MSKTVMRETNEKLREFEMRDVSTKKKKKVPPPPPPLPFKKKKKKKVPPPPPSFRNRTLDEEKKTSIPPPSFSNKIDGEKYGELHSFTTSEGQGEKYDSASTSSDEKKKPSLPPPPSKKKKCRRPKHTLFHPAAPGSDQNIDTTQAMASFEVEQPRRTSWIEAKAPSKISKCRYVSCFVCDRTCGHKDKRIRYSCRACCGITCCLILAYLIFATVMVFELLVLQDCNDVFRDPPCFDMTRLEFLDMTTNDIPFEFDANLNLPASSAMQVDIGTVKISVYDRTWSSLSFSFKHTRTHEQRQKQKRVKLK